MHTIHYLSCVRSTLVSSTCQCRNYLSQLTPLSLSPVLFVSACPRHHEFIISSIVMFANSDVNASYSTYSSSFRVMILELPYVKLCGDSCAVDLLLHFGFVGRHIRLVGMRSSNAESGWMTSRPFSQSIQWAFLSILSAASGSRRWCVVLGRCFCLQGRL